MDNQSSVEVTNVGSNEGARFVGAYVSFPVHEKERQVEVLRSFLALEDKISSKRIISGRIRDKLRPHRFTDEKLRVALDSLERGESDYLQILNYKIGEDWIHAADSMISFSWSSWMVVRSNRPKSPVEERFGDAGHMQIHYPQSRFWKDSESPFQQQLLDMLTKLWKENNLYWSFVHVGFHPGPQYFATHDNAFRETRDGFPITSFGFNLEAPIGIYREHVGGAFWANFLNPFHISRLGGLDRILQEHPCEIIQPLNDRGVLLQVTASPMAENPDALAQKYQRLRRFLAPILMETGDDMMRIQKEIMGSWKPPSRTKRRRRKELT